MRTTLSLEDDVARLLERLRRQRGGSFKKLVNEALREGLARLAAPRAPRKRQRTKGAALGRCLVGSVDDISDVLATAEGERFR